MVLPDLLLVSRDVNPHPVINHLAGMYIFVTYIRMMDDEITDESLVLDEEEQEEETEEDEKY